MFVAFIPLYPIQRIKGKQIYVHSLFDPLASYPEYTHRNGDVTVVGMTSILVATFSFLTSERNHLARPATSQIEA